MGDGPPREESPQCGNGHDVKVVPGVTRHNDNNHVPFFQMGDFKSTAPLTVTLEPDQHCMPGLGLSHEGGSLEVWAMRNCRAGESGGMVWGFHTCLSLQPQPGNLRDEDKPM